MGYSPWGHSESDMTKQLSGPVQMHQLPTKRGDSTAASSLGQRPLTHRGPAEKALHLQGTGILPQVCSFSEA